MHLDFFRSPWIALSNVKVLHNNYYNKYYNMYKLKKSPKAGKKFRVITAEGKKIDFGAKGYSDYTLHKNSFRMRLYVGRHGGKISKQIKNETNKLKVHKQVMKITSSSKENWSIKGINTPGFWSRWLLWSEPDLNKAKKYIETKFKIKII